MGALAVLLLGVLIVIGGVLFLRLHAFVALVGAALVVALLTPNRAVERQALVDRAQQYKFQVSDISSNGQRFQVRTSSASSASLLKASTRLAIVRPGQNPWNYEYVGTAVPDGTEFRDDAPQSPVTATAELAPGVGEVRSQDLLVLPADLGRAEAAGKVQAAERVATGFGNTAAGVGILVAFASIVGKCLLDSGSADRIVQSSLRVTGERGAPQAFVVSGFILGIPVFFDTVFYLMVPLAKALRLRTGRNFLLYVLTIIAGATMAHSLVPPTPGPLVAAEMLGVDIGLMILVGCVVGLGTSASGYAWALWISRRVELPLRETTGSAEAPDPDLRAPAPASLPPLWLALLPIALPVVLIGGREILRTAFALGPALSNAVDLVGNKNIALIVSAAIAVATLVRQRSLTVPQVSSAIQEALTGAGMIILITSAGGAFGAAIGQTGVATLIGQLPTQSVPAQLTLAFLITVAIRTAQGSATVAMITAASIFAPLATGGELAYHPVWLAVAIGCGSKAIAWMNDSGFWVITQMSGMTETEGLKYVTPMMIVMAIVGWLLVLIGALVFPMV
ncbi:MAG: GntP family permease [Pirellulaceae bacterium]